MKKFETLPECRQKLKDTSHSYYTIFTNVEFYSPRLARKMREIKLLCPSISKIVVSIMVWEEERLDLGSIARVFGLDPSTLKINGHFISRGVDLIASSVTWKSLLSFFSARGFSTAPLILEGKLSEVGSKSKHLSLCCMIKSSTFLSIKCSCSNQFKNLYMLAK